MNLGPCSLLFLAACQSAETSLDWIELSPDGTDFVHSESGERFFAWGFNYDHDAGGRLIEDYWIDEWATVLEDLREMQALGANVVRVHLQTGRFMSGRTEPDPAALGQLARLVKAAEDLGLYLDLTGLGCYHAADVPAWYDASSEVERWEVQARFWSSVARTCAGSPAIFCYDLMNEPILPGRAPESDWLAGEFGGKHFVQRIALDLDGRTRKEVARAWIEKLTAAIRVHDERHLITVGVIPWAMTFPGAQPLFHAPDVGRSLDFVSVHFYPERGEVQQALDALEVYAVGKPLVVEEIYTLRCGVDELDRFIEGSRDLTDGCIGFYWGETPAELASRPGIGAGITAAWLEYFAAKAPEMR